MQAFQQMAQGLQVNVGGAGFDQLAQQMQQATDAAQQYQSAAADAQSSILDQASAVAAAADGAQQYSAAAQQAVADTQNYAAATQDASSATQQASADSQQLAADVGAVAEAQQQTTQAVQEGTQAVQQHGEAAGQTVGNLGELRDAATELGGTAIPGLSASLGQAASLLGTVREASDGESQTLAVLGAGFTGVGLAIAGISFESFESGVESLHQLSLESGLTTAQVSGLQTAMSAVGVSADTTQTMVSIFSRQLQQMQQNIDQGKASTTPFAQALQELGISATDSNGHMQTMQQLLPQIMDAFQQANEKGVTPTGQAFNAAGVAIDLFGRSGAQLVPMLDEGTASFDKFTAAAEKGGYGSEQQVAHLEAWKASEAALTQQTQIFAASLGSDVAPILTTVAGDVESLTQFLNGLPGPVKDLVIVAPLAAGGFLLFASAIDSVVAKGAAFVGDNVATIGSLVGLGTSAEVATPALEGMSVAEGEAAAGAATLGAAEDAALGPIGLIVAGLTAGAVVFGLFTQHSNDAAEAEKQLAAATQAALPPIQQQVAAWQQAGMSADDAKAKVQELATFFGNAAQAQATAITQMQAQLKSAQAAAQADVSTGDTSAYAKDSAAVDDLKGRLTDLQQQQQANAAEAGAWNQQLSQMSTAEQNAADATSQVQSKLAGEAQGLDQAGLAAAQHADALKNIDSLAKSAAQSTDQQRLAESALTDVLNAEASGGSAVTQLQTTINDLKQHGTQAEKDYAAALENALNATNDYGGGVQGATQAQQAFNQALDQTPAKLNALLNPAQAINTAFTDALNSVNKLADAFSPYKAQIDTLQLAIDQNKASIDQWNATVANSSPIDQRIAALQSQIDKEQQSGQSTASSTKELDTQVGSLDANGRAIAEQIIGQQQHIDKINDENTTLTAQQQVYRTQQTVASDTATVQKDSSERAAKAFQDGAISIQQSGAAVDTSLAGVKLASIDMANGFTTEATLMANNFDQIAAHIQTTAGNLANVLKLAFAGLGAAAGNAAGGGAISAQAIASGLAANGISGDMLQTLTATILEESGGNLTIANNQGSGALGLGQFMPDTWNGVMAAMGLAGQYSTAADAPASVQLAAIAYLAQHAGLGQWEGYTTGAYTPFLGQAAAAIAANGGDAGGSALPGPSLPDVGSLFGNLPDVSGGAGGSLPVPSATGSSGGSSAGAVAKQATDYTSALDQVTQQLAKDQQTLNTLQDDYSKIIIVNAGATQAQVVQTQAQVVATNALSASLSEAARAQAGIGTTGAEAGPGGRTLLGQTPQIVNGSGGGGGLGGATLPSGGGGGLSSYDGSATLANLIGGQTGAGNIAPAIVQTTADINQQTAAVQDDSAAFVNLIGQATGVGNLVPPLQATDDVMHNISLGSQEAAQGMAAVAAAGSQAAQQSQGDWLDAYHAMTDASKTVSRQQVDDAGQAADALGLTAQQANLTAQADVQQAQQSEAAYQQLLQAKKDGQSVSDQDLQNAKDQADADQKTADTAVTAAGNAKTAWHDAYQTATQDAAAYDAKLLQITTDEDNAGNAAIQMQQNVQNALLPPGTSNAVKDALVTPQDVATAQANANAIQTQLIPAQMQYNALYKQYLNDLKTDPNGNNAQTQADQTAAANFKKNTLDPLQNGYNQALQIVTNGENAITQQQQTAAQFRAGANQQGLQAQLDADQRAYTKAVADLTNVLSTETWLYQQANTAQMNGNQALADQIRNVVIPALQAQAQADSDAAQKALQNASDQKAAFQSTTQSAQQATQAVQQHTAASQLGGAVSGNLSAIVAGRQGLAFTDAIYNTYQMYTPMQMFGDMLARNASALNANTNAVNQNTGSKGGTVKLPNGQTADSAVYYYTTAAAGPK